MVTMRSDIARRVEEIVVTEVKPILAEKGSPWKFTEEQRLYDPIDGARFRFDDFLVFADIVHEEFGDFEENWNNATTFEDVIDDILQALEVQSA